VEGGSANNYDYCSGDPVNCNDLDGTKTRPLTPKEAQEVGSIAADCIGGPDAAYSGSSFCRGFLNALSEGDLTDYGFGFVSAGSGACPGWLKGFSRFFGVDDFFRSANDLRQSHFDDALRNASSSGGSNGPQSDLAKQLERSGTTVAKEIAKYSVAGTMAGTAIDAVCTTAP
jgi:hypothetical protein